MNRKTLLIFAVLSSLFVSCSIDKEIQIGALNNIILKGMADNTIKCSADIQITNNSAFSYKLETNELHVFAADDDFGIVKLTNEIKIPKHTNKNYTIDFEVAINNSEVGIISAVNSLMGKKTKYSLRGEIKARSCIFHKTIKVNETLGNW